MSKIKKNLWRHVLQLGVIAVIAGFILKVFFGGAPADVEAYCPFGGLQSLVTYLNPDPRTALHSFCSQNDARI